jgi:HKD family nuclease
VGTAGFDDYHIQQFPKMFVAPVQDDDLINLIKSELNQSDKAWIASAFYSPGITNLLLPCFDKFIGNDGKLWILLSTMGNSTPPEYFRHLREFAPLVNFRIFHPPEVGFDKSPPNFHVKAYLFHRRNGMGTMLIGSSNFTEAGFFRNVEWNYFSQGEVNLPFDGPSPFQTALATFEKYWLEAAIDVTDDFLAAYERRREKAFGYQPSETTYVFRSENLELFQRQAPFSPRIMPNEAQKRGLDNLASMREQGIEKAAVVAATGIGKTYLAAFDFKQSHCRNLLYIAHRENILAKARSSFCQVLGDAGFGENGEKQAAGLQRLQGTFAMVQTLSRKANLKKYSPEDFDYIVMDEFHHSEADTYRRVLKHFRPKFFLGLTATPERMDGRDVLFHCDYNIAYELRLLDAVDGGFLVPFQYFAIYDETDYSQIAWRGTGYDEIELDRALINDNRTAIIAHNLRRFLPSHGKIKSLAFCSSVSHAAFTARQLSRQHGIESISLIGLSKESDR